MTKHHQVNALPVGYNLLWYEIIRVIGKGGFGITYLARDKNLNIDVAIKEYLPEDFASRLDENTVTPKSKQETMYTWGLERFIDEARKLAKFYHPNIVRVLSVFEHNGTAYMVMEYAKGEDLSVVYKTRPPFGQEQYLDIFIPIMDGLALIHNAGYIHRDIKPANIYICQNDSPILLDFGSARQSVGHQTRALTSLVTVGYAPFEQYNEGDKKQGPWTDIYSLGASIYVGITGEKPVDALKRGGAILDRGIDPYKPLSMVAAGRFKDNFLLAIDNALMFKAEDRPRNIMAWADMLLGKTAAAQLPDYMLADEAEAEPETVVFSEDYSKPSTTASSRGTQGLVDTHGRRVSDVEQNSVQVAQDKLPVRISRWFSELHLSMLQLAIAGTAMFVVISIGVYLWQQPSQVVPAVDSQQESVIDETTAKINELLASAIEKQKQGRVFKPDNDNAVYFYSQVLKLDVDNKQAIDALSGIHRQLIAQARDQVEAQKLTAAAQSLALAEFLFPGNKQNEKLKQLLQAGEQQQQVSQLLEKAGSALKDKKFTQPSSDNALAYFKRVVELEPNNRAARDGIRQIETGLLALATSSIKSGKLDQAGAYLDQVDMVNSDSRQSKELRKQIAQQSSKSSTLQALLSTAQSQYNKKRYTSPAGDNAYETYKKVLTIDPGNQKAKTGISNIKKYYKKRFDKYILAGQLSQAQRDVNIMQRIAGGEWVTRQMQKTLAEKREQQKPKTPEIELISDLVGKFKTGLEIRNVKSIKNISKFSPGRQRFVEQLLVQYKQLTVNISGFQYIANNHQATANVELSDLVDKNDRAVTPGAWSKFPIKIAKDGRQEFKVYW